MVPIFRTILKYLPTAVLALVLAVAVWISAVTEADPTIERQYARAVPVELVGQDPGLIITSDVPTQVSITLAAPQSIWNGLQTDTSAVRAVADLSGLGAGVHTVPIVVQVAIRPVEVVSSNPRALNLTLEPLDTRTVAINLITTGEPAVGFFAETPVLNVTEATVSGPQSLVDQVQEVRATLDINQVRENINRSLPLQAVDASGLPVSEVSVSPEQVAVSQSVANRGGYRNVVVKVATSGQIATGYRLTNISVFPPAVTVFSTDPQIVEDLPGYVETASLDLTSARDDLDVRLPIELPPGVSVVGDQTVSVQVGIAAIESSITLSAMRVEVIGLTEGQAATTSPETVDVILSGPLPLLDSLSRDNVHVVIEMTGEGLGTYQRVPRVELDVSELQVESVLPGTVEVTIIRAPQPTPTPR